MTDEDKGKGKGKAHPSQPPRAAEDDGTSASQVGTGRSAALTLSSALRTTMASAQLGSLVQTAAGGKADFQSLGGGKDLREWLVEDLRASSTASSSATSGGQVGRIEGKAFRSSKSQAEQDLEQTDLFKDFERGLVLDNRSNVHLTPIVAGNGADLERAWQEGQNLQQSSGWLKTGLDPNSARPIGSFVELDAPLHSSVRRDHAQSTTAAVSTGHSNAPATALRAPLAETEDIFALLDAEQPQKQQQPGAAKRNTIPPSQDPGTQSSHEVLSHFDSAYRAPSPSNTSFSRDQAAMHLALAEAQASEQGRQELAIPRPDDPASHEGVYAATAEEALKSIFERRAEPSNATEETVEEQTDRGQEVVKKITSWFGTSSYLDDVYGSAPLLKETIEQVVRPKADQAGNTEENREKAIRRLESLWNHLSNTPPAPQPGDSMGNSGDWVDSWLRNNT